MPTQSTSRSPIVLLHWLWPFCILASFGSGLQIWLNHARVEPYIISFARHFAIDDDSFQWHLVSGLLLSFSLTLYLSHLFLKRPSGLSRLVPSVSAGIRWNLTVVSLWTLCLMMLSGWLLQLESSSDFRSLLVSMHWLFLWMLLMSSLGHLALELKARTIPAMWRYWAQNYDLRMSHLLWLFLGCMVSLILLISGLAWSRQLDVPFVPQVPRIDGKLNDEAWQQAGYTTVYLHNHNAEGWWNRSHGNAVEVRAVHNNEHVYFSFRWQDHSKSLAHLPLRFTTNGPEGASRWELMQKGFWQDDERQFYEDKFAVLVSNHGLMAAMRSIHLGTNILGSAPVSRHGRGYHFFSEDELADLWQWKATRTNPLFQADDNHFSSPYPVRECEVRYTAGYNKDPKLKGGYELNWTINSEGLVFPKRLPTSSHFVSTALAIEESEHERLYSMRIADSESNRVSRFAPMPNNGVIPSILRSDAFEGDRGHVAARAHWNAGYWELEMSRALRTGSDFDQELMDGTLVWLASFDHAQTRHAYHLRPVRLRLQERQQRPTGELSK